MTRNLTSTSSGNSPGAWGKSDGSGLDSHIRDCLDIFSAVKAIIPLLPRAARTDNFWDLLFWAVFFHDFGKLHPEFQKVLQHADNLWEGQRHELFSLPFAKNFSKSIALSEQDTELICQAILAHHKDFELLKDKFKPQWQLEMEIEEDRRYRAQAHHPEDFAHAMAAIISTPYFKAFISKARDLANDFGYDFGYEADIEVPGAEQLAGPHPYEAVAKPYQPPPFHTDIYWQQMLLWGTLKLCDHYGSARIPKLYSLNPSHFSFLDRLRTAHGSLYSHQEACAATAGNLVLVAPTGSGKTEAAMGWLKTQLEQHQGRAYYILPYTASINAMHRRLTRDTGAGNDPLVGVQHGKLMDYLYTLTEEGKKTDHAALKALAAQYRTIVAPLKVATPFQILKFGYGVKGFETGLAHLSGATLIFDEIHAYDSRTFAQLMVFLNYLTTCLACRIMIMTATLPCFMLDALKKALGIDGAITADKTFLSRPPRHRVVLLEGGIRDHMDKIETALAKSDQKILVVCNTVAQAQDIFADLSIHLDPDQAVLLHSRFTSQDRQHQEQRIFSDQTRLLVGTQAIEVSLDIDFDLMFTEPAPLDRLLQRFGRINRRCERPPCPVHIFTRGGENDHWIYPEALVRATLDCLAPLDLIHEHKVQAMMDTVYKDGWPENEKKDYDNTLAAFEHALATLSPFKRHREEEEKFYEQFTGVQVLPAPLFAAYRDRLRNKEFILADQLLVSLQAAGFRKLLGNEQITFQRIPISDDTDTRQDHWIPVANCRYDPDIGMTNEFQAFCDDEIFFG